MYKYIILLVLTLPLAVAAQSIEGKVTDNNGNPLIGASVNWLGLTIATVTGEDGAFEISDEGIKDHRLVFRYVGYKPDTVSTTANAFINVQLSETTTLEEIKVSGERPGSYYSSIEAQKVEVITQAELTKAACCDLAGCFNTQGSVQPTTTNIVTNAKELRILGLSGVYNQVLIDGMPLIQGLSYTYGISAIPGTLVDNIYIAKGANSVLQGFESMSGQINVELKEPDEAEKLLLNAYVNSFLESQFNANYTKKWDKWSTLIAAHTTQPSRKIDRDEDSFLDLPLLSRYSLYNKWKFGDPGEWGWHSRIGLRYVNEQRIGGQMDFNPDNDEGTTNVYGQSVQISQPELYTRTGYRMDGRHHFVFLASAFYQDQSSYFGTVHYKADQLSAYSNIQYELTWKETHTLKTGLSYRHLRLDEDISIGQDSLNRTYSGQYKKEEQIPGVFAENTFTWNDRAISLITGVRADYHNTFGWFVTPRTLFKYDFTEFTTARASIGLGWKTVNLFSENINLLASSRDIIITEQLEPERALNYGTNLIHRIYGNNIETQLSLDFYHTQFFNQIFPDYDTDPTRAYISNFEGKSISNGFQAEAGFDLYERVGIKIAYNFLDVYRVVAGEKYTLPFNAKHRMTGVLSYKPLTKKWHIDVNAHWFGEQRLANTTANPDEYQLPEKSKSYSVFNAQFTKIWKQFEVYAGCENIFDFRQKRPILSWEDPFGPYFDTSSVWGPTKGREIYLGLRFTLK